MWDGQQAETSFLSCSPWQYTQTLADIAAKPHAQPECFKRPHECVLPTCSPNLTGGRQFVHHRLLEAKSHGFPQAACPTSSKGLDPLVGLVMESVPHGNRGFKMALETTHREVKKAPSGTKPFGVALGKADRPWLSLQIPTLQSPAPTHSPNNSCRHIFAANF